MKPTLSIVLMASCTLVSFYTHGTWRNHFLQVSAISELGSSFPEIGVECSRLDLRMDRLARNLEIRAERWIDANGGQQISHQGITPVLRLSYSAIPGLLFSEESHP